MVLSVKKADPWRNAIVRYADEDPASLQPHPKNWRRHPQTQTAALNGSLTELGWIAPVIVNETTSHVVDGHARIGEAISRGEPTVPVAYVRLTEDQERLALATFDPIAALAETDQAMLDDLLADVATENDGLQAMLDLLVSVDPTDPEAEWQGMPAFEQEDLRPVKQVIVSFARLDDMEAFARLLGQRLTSETKSVWYPPQPKIDHNRAYVIAGEDNAV